MPTVLPQYENSYSEADYALQSVEDWQSELDVIRSFALQRPAIVRTHLQMQFKFIE